VNVGFVKLSFCSFSLPFGSDKRSCNSICLEMRVTIYERHRETKVAEV